MIKEETLTYKTLTNVEQSKSLNNLILQFKLAGGRVKITKQLLSKIKIYTH